MAGGAAKKQLAENSKRLKWIAAAIAAADVLYGLGRVAWDWPSWTAGPIAVAVLCNVFAIGSFMIMWNAAKPAYEGKELSYGGADLGNHGFFEYLHDILIVSLVVLVLEIVWGSAWLLLLAIPCYALFKAWTMFISPWLASNAASAAAAAAAASAAAASQPRAAVDKKGRPIKGKPAAPGAPRVLHR